MKNRLIIFFILLMIFALNCDNSTKSKVDKYSGIIKNVDFDQLFAEPSNKEIEAIETSWHSFNSNITSMSIVDTSYIFIGTQMHLIITVSHTNAENVVHYGSVVLPADLTQSYPVMFYNHGGDDGVDISSFTSIAGFSPDMVEISNNFVIAIPSFRSEKLTISETKFFQSTGDPSPWDKDVEDCMDFLTTISTLFDQVDESAVFVVGLSRGAGVSMLWSARDSRVDKVVDFFGPTNLMSEWTKEITYNALNGTLEDLPGIDYLDANIIQPLKNGNLSISDARTELIKRSPIYFLSSITPLQVHHGLEDEIVPVSQTEDLIEKASELHLSTDDFQSFLYEYSGHDENTFIKGIDEMKNFIFY